MNNTDMGYSVFFVINLKPLRCSQVTLRSRLETSYKSRYQCFIKPYSHVDPTPSTASHSKKLLRYSSSEASCWNSLTDLLLSRKSFVMYLICVCLEPQLPFLLTLLFSAPSVIFPYLLNFEVVFRVSS